MIAAWVFGIFVIPMLYVVFQWLRERVSKRGTAGPPAPKHAPAVQTPAGIEGG